MSKDVRQLSFATWLRVASMLLILLCHYCAACDVPAVTMPSQIFNIGVQLFFILSGFLVGYKGISRPYTKWYLKRVKRIFVPYWLFLAALVGVHVAKGLDIFTTDWLLLVLGCQGSVVGVLGAEQTWFISVLLLCYLLSPAILWTNKKLLQLNNKGITIGAYGTVCALPILYAVAEPDWVYTLLTPVSLYAIACVYGGYYRKNNGYTRSPKLLLWSFAVIAAAFSLRFASRALIDGTIWYTRIIVPYTHMVAAAAIWLSFETVFQTDCAPPKAIQFAGDLSFEIYLWHYMFVVGPVSIFAMVNNWTAACIATTMVVFALSFVSRKITAFLSTNPFKK
jgi:peptidoglycan/LPS O-acetylase OafA/YrhL